MVPSTSTGVLEGVLSNAFGSFSGNQLDALNNVLVNLQFYKKQNRVKIKV